MSEGDAILLIIVGLAAVPIDAVGATSLKGFAVAGLGYLWLGLMFCLLLVEAAVLL